MLADIFDQTLDDFFEMEKENILLGVSERNLCARFSMLLDKTVKNNGIKGYYTDPEYNRTKNGAIKTIVDNDMKEINITCDIVLHSRGEIQGRDNLIAIEMKKSERPDQEKNNDRLRLKALTKPVDEVWSADGITNPKYVCGYELGYFLEIDLKQKMYILEKFEKGIHIYSKTVNFG